MDYITLDDVELPADMQWTDEFKSTQVRQSVTPSLTGASIVMANKMLAARPITLEGAFSGNEGYAVVPRATVIALRAKEVTPATPMVLTFSDGRTYDVIFRYDNGGVAIDASPLKPIDPPEDSDWYLLKINLMTI